MNTTLLIIYLIPLFLYIFITAFLYSRDKIHKDVVIGIGLLMLFWPLTIPIIIPLVILYYIWEFFVYLFEKYIPMKG